MSKVWSVGVFVEDDNYEIGNPPQNLIKLFNAKQIRTQKKHVHTYADPFLFVQNEVLYLFIEIQEISSAGYINAWKTEDLEQWHEEGVILKEDFHCSYPFVFTDVKGHVLMLPETGESGKISMYQFSDFPKKLQRVETLLIGRYADSNIIYKDGIYYLCTLNMQTQGLELYFSNTLENSTWNLHPKSPVSTDKHHSRNGGGFIEYNGKLYRIAQNCSSRYGEGIVILEVLQLNEREYEEKIINGNFKPALNFEWQKEGRHHLSMVTYKGKKIIAMDGLQNDYFLNKAINLLFKLIK